MKKCPDCDKEVDKYAIACQYCGKIPEGKESEEKSNDAQDKSGEGHEH